MATALYDDSEDDDPEEEDWEESVERCHYSKSHHDEYIEVSDPNIKEIIKQKLKAMFLQDKIYEGMLRLRLDEETKFLRENIDLITANFWEDFINPDQSSSDRTRNMVYSMYSEAFLEGQLQKAKGKISTRMSRASEHLDEELDHVTEEIMRKINGVVRVQRKKTDKRKHGTCSGVVVRLNWSGTGCSPNTSEDFAILTSNHLIADKSEAAGATIDFFYDESANKGQCSPQPQQAPKGVVTREVTSLVTVSPRVPSGDKASEDKMDFSLLKFNVEYSDKDDLTYEKLKDCALYLNEFFENDLYFRPSIDFFKSIPLISISHPHGSNKRISFGSLNLDEVNALSDSPRYDTEYDLATCKGSSGCPVIAIHINSRGELKPCFQFLHFKRKSGIVMRQVYKACKDRKEIEQYEMFSDPRNSSEQISGSRQLHPVWYDEEDREQVWWTAKYRPVSEAQQSRRPSK